MADDQFCLRWNNHQKTLVSIFGKLLKDESLVDCIISAEGKHIQAHKLILSACSEYFQSLLCQRPDAYPIIILNNMTYENVKAVVDYMYDGEVNITQDKLQDFLEVAKCLKIKGLSDGCPENEEPEQSRVEEPPWKPPTATPSPQLKAPLPQKLQSESKRTTSQMDYNSDSSRSTTSSPTMGKRRRIQRKPSEDGSAFLNNDNRTFDNSKEFQSTPLVTKKVPIAPVVATHLNVTMPSPILPKVTSLLVPSVSRQTLNAESGSTSLPPESGLLAAKDEPVTEPFMIPKTEYLYDNNEDIEDLTLDDDEEEYDMSRPGPSNEDDTNQSFGQWDMSENQSRLNDSTLSASAAGNNSQDFSSELFSSFETIVEDCDSKNFNSSLKYTGDLLSQKCKANEGLVYSMYPCSNCNRRYKYKSDLKRHERDECGKEPQFPCHLCPYRAKQKRNLKGHILLKHKILVSGQNHQN